MKLSQIPGNDFPMTKVFLTLLLAGLMVAIKANPICKDKNTIFFADFDNYNYNANHAVGDKNAKTYGHPAFKAGKYGSAISLTRNNFLEYSARGNINSNKGTLEFRFKTMKLNGENRRHLITVYNSERERFYIRQSAPGGIYMFFTNNSGSGAGMTYDKTADGWHHIAITWEKKERFTKLNGYVDGTLKVSKNIPDFADFSKGKIIVGAYAKKILPLNGLIDDFRISDNVRYTLERYPDFISVPGSTSLKKGFNTIKNAWRLIHNRQEQNKAQVLSAKIKHQLTKYDSLPLMQKKSGFEAIQTNLQNYETYVLPALWWQHKKTEEFAALSVTCMKKITDRWRGMPAKSQNIELNSAGGEWQCFQIILAPGFNDIEKISVMSSPLVGKRTISSQAIRISRVGMITPEHKRPRKVWADPIYPVKSFFSLKKDRIQPLWIAIKIPADIPAGTYTGQITIKGVSLTKVIPYKIKKYAFSLPLKPRLKTAFGFSGSWMAWAHKLKSPGQIDDLLNVYLKNMLEYKVSPKALWRGRGLNHGDRYFLAPKIILTKDEKWEIDFSDYDKQLDQLLPLGLNTIMVGNRTWDGNSRRFKDVKKGKRKIPYFDEVTGKEKTLLLPVLSKQNEKMSKWIVKEWYNHLKKRGLNKLTYSYPCDEPLSRMRPMVNTFCTWIHEAAPGLPTLVTSTPSNNCPNVDIWCPLTRTLPSKVVQNYYKNHKKEFWTYVCCAPLSPSPNFFIHQTALENRLPFWIVTKYGAKGFLYYETGRSMWHRSDVWKDPTWFGSVGTEGDGFLMYPGQHGPINTIRFEYVRQGIQDVEYFLMLQDLIKQLPAGGKLRTQALILLHLDDNFIKDTFHYNQKWKKFAERKHQVGLMIEKVLQELKKKK
jgi:Glycoside hydrolase 123, catalytic domain/Concanavalin A-like lectin/glucanases superfamily/Glycoside hydrolase 123 N-terminal domain